MDHRSLPPVPIKDTGKAERDEDGEGVGGLGGNKSADNADIMRENESDIRRANTGGGLGVEAMKDKKKI